MAMMIVECGMIAEDAKRVERAAIMAGMSISDFIAKALEEVCERREREVVRI